MSRRASPNGRVGSSLRSFLDVVGQVAVFVFSLTECGDQLSQWRAYSGVGGGYALGFHRDVLGVIAAEEEGHLIPCEYDEADQLDLLRPLLVEMVTTAEALPEEARGLDLYTEFADRFPLLAASLKHHSFAEEREWRLLFGPGIDPARTDARASGSILVPYFKCPIRRNGRYPLAEVVVGPSPTAHLAGRSLRYITTSKLGWPVKVIPSDSSFRAF